MDNHFPDLATVPMPVAKPPQRRRKPWLIASLIIGVVVLLVIGVSIVGAILRLSPSQTGHASNASSTPTALQTGQAANAATPTAKSAQAASTSTSTSTSPAVAAPTPTPEIGQPSATHGRPRLGGPFSDFVGKYGTPGNQGDSSGENFWVGTDQTIDINVARDEQGAVTQLNILGPMSWDTQQAQSYCVQFLPDNAVQFKATSTEIDYHSSAGEVVLTLQAQSCLLSFARP